MAPRRRPKPKAPRRKKERKQHRGATYGAGVRYEYRVRDMLIARGYSAKRVAGSRGQIDVIAWNKKVIKFVQVKAMKAFPNDPLPKDLRREFRDLRYLAIPPNGRREMWVFRKRARPVHLTIYRMDA